jgi:predicted transcriptional regulator
MKTIVKIGGSEEFFKRGREIAKLADQGKPIPCERIISFEDPDDMAKLITTAKLSLFREIKLHPGSIQEISDRLKRDRSAVKRDIADLEKAGLLEIEDVPFPGHGRKKEVRVIACQVLLAL